MARRGHLVPSSVPTSSSDPAPALTLRKEDKLAGHNGRVFDLQASVKDLSSSQPLRIAAVGEKGGSVWTFDGGARRHVRLPGTELMRVCWHPDGEHVLTGSAEGAICVRDASSGQTSATLQAAREDEVYGLEVLSEEGLLAAGAGETVQLWDLNRATRTSLAAFTATESGVHFGGLRNPDRKAFVFSIAARGRILSAALSDGSLRLLDSETLQELATLCVSNEAPALATAISPTSPLLACSDRAGGVLLWDLRQLGRGPLGETESSGGGAVHSVRFVPGELLVTGGDDRRLCVHETRTAQLALQCCASVLSPLLCVDAAADGASTRLATAGGSIGLVSDSNIGLWRLGAEQEQKRPEEEGGVPGAEEGVCMVCRPCGQ